MGKCISGLMAALLSATLLFGGMLPAEAGAAPVVVTELKGEINHSSAALLKRAVAEAEKQQARAVVIELDTFGGLVSSATVMRDLLTQTSVPTICYIKNRAWSAGALVALSSRRIVMAPGGSMGAAEPIPATEKNIAAVKAEFSATAKLYGRNAKAAEAMVDKTLGFPGYAEPGKILALTADQAVDIGYAEFVAPERAALLARLEMADAPLVIYQASLADKVAGWLSDSAVQGILLSVIMLAVFTEIKTAGLGVAGGIGLLAAVLFFGSQWLAGVAGWLELSLFIGGVLLIILEIFLPSGGLLGAGGGSCILASFFLTLGGNMAAAQMMLASLLGAVAAFLLLLRFLPESRLWNKLILADSETRQAGFSTSLDYSIYQGQEGVVVTLLRPAGKVDIDGRQLDVVSDGQYLPPGTKVKVTEVSGARIVVQSIE